MYAARWPITELRDVGEGIPKEVGHKQRARGKMVQTRHITRKIPEARKHLVEPGKQGSSDEDEGM